MVAVIRATDTLLSSEHLTRSSHTSFYPLMMIVALWKFSLYYCSTKNGISRMVFVLYRLLQYIQCELRTASSEVWGYHAIKVEVGPTNRNAILHSLLQVCLSVIGQLLKGVLPSLIRCAFGTRKPSLEVCNCWGATVHLDSSEMVCPRSLATYLR